MIKSANRTLVLLTALVLLSSAVQAQNYKTGVGIRFGGLTNGLSIKHFTAPTIALEGLLSTANNGFFFTGLYEKHAAVGNDPALRLVYGIGGHLGFFNEDGYYYYSKKKYYNRGVRVSIVGLDAIVGLEYKFKNAPLSMGIDVKPFIDLNNGSYIYADGGVSLRYVF
jgi:hypothetical protein